MEVMMTVFNAFLLKAVDSIYKNWSLKGYASAAYTHDLQFGNNLIKATKPPFTMCVAAQMEIIITALNIYSQETGDTSCFSFLPPKQWTSLAPGTFKDLVWVNSGSRGTADALEIYGMGKIAPFNELQPGCFVNLNRNNKTGHATLFLGFIDSQGNLLDSYSEIVAGFKYFSSQGKEIGGGFDYRYAFFHDICPVLASSKKRDCGVIWSKDQKYLNTGFMLAPSHWDSEKRDNRLKMKSQKTLVDNQVNPAYIEQITTDDQ